MSDLAKLRHRAATLGMAVRTSRSRNIHIDDLGGYMLVDAASNTVVDGARFELELPELEQAIAFWEAAA